MLRPSHSRKSTAGLVFYGPVQGAFRFKKRRRVKGRRNPRNLIQVEVRGGQVAKITPPNNR